MAQRLCHGFSHWWTSGKPGNILIMFVYAVTIFTGAFLLFQVQPLIGKYILPWFGGAPGVWSTCMLFFQVLLLGGYAYAYVISRWLKPHLQAITHLLLLACAVALLPITPADSWKPPGSGSPTWQILCILTASLGLPYFILSATGPLLQHWFSRTNPGTSPYRLYALSNIGSLLALFSFPVYFESHFTRITQATLWGWGLIMYALGCAFCTIKLWKTRDKKNRTDGKSGDGPGLPNHKIKPATRRPATPPEYTSYGALLIRLYWLLLPACASLLLVATTNKICQEVAVIPFLWVLPLALYLLSFIICFDNPRWYVRALFIPALVAAWAGVCFALFKSTELSTPLQISIYTSSLLICCMVCHGELYRLRPDSERLTEFYLLIAAGGALGGFFVAGIAPVIFSDYFELQWGLLLCGLLILQIIRCATDEEIVRWRPSGCLWLTVCLLALGAGLWLQARQITGLTVYRARNFYGVLKVLRIVPREPHHQQLVLAHGRTWHGMQFIEPPKTAWPTLYYGEQSGIGYALRTLPSKQRRIGAIGLGTGTLATYVRAQDYFHIYEINPEVLRIATSQFSYLSNCQGKVDVTLGDARLSLEREAPQNFDILILDAFNSDAVPVHLLTKEALMIYEKHLKTNGMIAIHVSNISMNLEPVVANLAVHFGYAMAVIDHDTPRDQPWILRSVWILLSRNKENINSTEIRNAARPVEASPQQISLWTDDFASLFQILRFQTPYANPAFSEEQIKTASILSQQGDFKGAIAIYHSALQTHPDLPELLNNLAWLEATCPNTACRDGIQAVKNAERACELSHYGVASMVGTLAAAYAEAGRFDDAITAGERACDRATKNGEVHLVQRNEELLALYRNHQAYHEK